MGKQIWCVLKQADIVTRKRQNSFLSSTNYVHLVLFNSITETPIIFHRDSTN